MSSMWRNSNLFSSGFSTWASQIALAVVWGRNFPAWTATPRCGVGFSGYLLRVKS